MPACTRDKAATAADESKLPSSAMQVPAIALSRATLLGRPEVPNRSASSVSTSTDQSGSTIAAIHRRPRASRWLVTHSAPAMPGAPASGRRSTITSGRTARTTAERSAGVGSPSIALTLVVQRGPGSTAVAAHRDAYSGARVRASPSSVSTIVRSADPNASPTSNANGERTPGRSRCRNSMRRGRRSAAARSGAYRNDSDTSTSAASRTSATSSLVACVTSIRPKSSRMGSYSGSRSHPSVTPGPSATPALHRASSTARRSASGRRLRRASAARATPCMEFAVPRSLSTIERSKAIRINPASASPMSSAASVGGETDPSTRRAASSAARNRSAYRPSIGFTATSAQLDAERGQEAAA